MMKERTSWIPLLTFMTPQTSDHKAPAAAAAIIQSGICITAGTSTKIPISAAASVPTTNCPSAPILNTPVRKENATERPVRIGTSTVAPNIANMCWKPSTSIFPPPRVLAS